MKNQALLNYLFIYKAQAFSSGVFGYQFRPPPFQPNFFSCQYIRHLRTAHRYPVFRVSLNIVEQCNARERRYDISRTMTPSTVHLLSSIQLDQLAWYGRTELRPDETYCFCVYVTHFHWRCWYEQQLSRRLIERAGRGNESLTGQRDESHTGNKINWLWR